MALLVGENPCHHFPGVKVDIVLQKMIEAVIARDLKFRSNPQLGSSLLCTLDGLDNSGCVTLP